MRRKILRQVGFTSLASGALVVAGLVGAGAAQAATSYQHISDYASFSACDSAGHSGETNGTYQDYYCFKYDNYPGLPPGEGPAWHTVTYQLYAQLTPPSQPCTSHPGWVDPGNPHACWPY